MSTVATREHEATARDRFDEWSQSDTFRRLGPWLRFVQNALLETMDWRGVSRVLDVACGSGWAVHVAARRLGEVPGGLACGCDLSRGMLAAQREASNGQRVGFFVASAQALPYRSESFDVILCTAAFHHFPIPEKALSEFRHVLCSGGYMLIADTCRDQSYGAWAWDRLHRWFEPGHVKYYRVDEMRDMLRGAGFYLSQVTKLRPTFGDTKKLVRDAALFLATRR